MTDTLILGLGNPLMGDDGAGPAVVSLLEAAGISAETRCLITPGFSLLTFLQDRKRIFLVDAAQFGAKPGEVRRAEPHEILDRSGSPAFSLHDAGVLSVMREAEKLNLTIGKVIIYCIQLKEMVPGREICPEVMEGVRKTAELISKEMAHA